MANTMTNELQTIKKKTSLGMTGGFDNNIHKAKLGNMSKANLKTISKRAFLGGIIFALLPIFSLLLSWILSNVLSCDPARTGEYVCSVGPTFVGEMLYSMFVFGMYAFYSIPLGLLVALISGTTFLIVRKK